MIIGILFSLTSAFAVTENDVANAVLKNFPLIEQAQLKLDASRGNVTAAQGAFDHKVTFKTRNRIEDRYENHYFEGVIERQTGLGGLSLFAGHRQGTGRFAAYEGKYDTSSAGEVFAGITLPVLRNFQTDEMRTGLLMAKLDKNISYLELDLKKNIYLHKALSLFYKWVVANQKVKIREEVLKIAEERQSMLEKKFNAGDIDRLKLTDNKRSIDKRKSELLEAKIELNDYQTNLSLYYRDSSGNPIMISEVLFPEATLPRYTPVIFSRDALPQLSIIEQELQKQEAERKLYKQSQLPGLNVEFLGARETSGNVPYDPERLQLGVKFDLPIENRKAEGKTSASEYKFQALQKERDFMFQELSRLFRFSEDAVQVSKSRWEITNSEYEKTIELAKAERTRWTQGASDLYIVNLREQDTAEADIKRWSAWFEYHQYHLDARLFSGTLKKASEAGSI